MGGLRAPRINVIGFERRFFSLTEGIDELGLVWPDSRRILDLSEVGVMAVRYSMLSQSDEELEANWRILKASGKPMSADLNGKATPFAQLFVDKGLVAVSTWDGGTFGWEPMKKTGGYLFFVEAWRNRRFTPESMIWRGAEENGWYRVLEVQATYGARRIPAEDLASQLVAARAKLVESGTVPILSPTALTEPPAGGGPKAEDPKSA